jgi:hydrogenase maturation protease
MSGAVAPCLVLGWGNPSRGDDALGPLLVEQLQQRLAAAGLSPQVECLTDFQLQIEHALDLAGRERVLLVDASRDAVAPFEVTTSHPARDATFSSHALSPAALLQVHVDVYGRAPPPTTLLAIRARHFELGEPPGADALAHGEQALTWAEHWILNDLQSTATSACDKGSVPATDPRVDHSRTASPGRD